MKKNTIWYILVIFTFIIWGTQHPAIKILSGEIPPFLFNFLRFLIAGLVLLPVILYQKIIPNKKDLLKISLLGIIGVSLLGMFQIIGIKLSTATNSAILINTSPLLIAILAPLLIKENISSKKAIGILLGFAGVLIIITNGINIFDMLRSEYFFGNVLLFSCALYVAIYAIYNKSLIKKYGGLTVTFYAVIAGTIILFLFSMINGEITYISDISMNSLLLIAYVAIFTTSLTWVVWFTIINKIGVIRTSSLFFIIPISGIIFSNLILNESLTYFTAIGTFLTLTGIYIAQRK